MWFSAMHLGGFVLCLVVFLSVCVAQGQAARAATVAATTAAANKNGPLQTFKRTIIESRRHLAAAAVARSTSIFLMYPVDTIKTRMQMDQANALRLAGIFSGVAGSLFGQVPYGVLTFGSYEMYKKNLMDRFPNVQPVFKYALSAILGDLTGSGWLCPSEVVKQQMQAGMHSSTLAAIQSIWKKKGLVGFYQGYFGGVARDVPFRVAQLTSFEVTKNVALRIKARRVWQEAQDKNKRKNSKNKKTIMSQEEMEEIKKTLELSRVESAVCGAVAGTFSAAITAPLDRIKTLLMTDSAAYGGTILSCTSQILKNEGLPGLFTGVVPRVIYIAPSVVIFFVVYEEVQQRLKQREKKN